MINSLQIFVKVRNDQYEGTRLYVGVLLFTHISSYPNTK